MIEFAAYIEENWKLPYDVAEDICHYYEGGNSRFFVNDYVPTIATQTDIDTLSEIYAFLDTQKELDPLRDRARSVLEKAELLDDEYEDKISLSISEAEVEDLFLAFRTNVRTKGQIAIGRGLKELADLVDAQETEGSFDTEAEKYVGKDEALKTVEDVRAGVKDILAELYGYEEEARLMLREYAFDEGCVELHFKKKTKKFDSYRNNDVKLVDLSYKDLLTLRDGELKDEIKMKVSVPLFQVMELMREHFVENETCLGADLVSEAIDDAWERLLRPMIEESVKQELFNEALVKVSSVVKADLRPLVEAHAQAGKQTVLIVSCSSEESIELMVLDNNGSLLRSTLESVREFGRPFVSKKIKQLFEVYHPGTVAVLNNKYGDYSVSVVEQSIKVVVSKPEVVRIPATTKVAGLLRSEFFKENTQGLSEEAVKTFAYGIALLKPFSIISEIGVECFTLHADEKLLGNEQMSKIVDELFTAGSLKYGVEVGKKRDNLLVNLGITEEKLEALRKAKKENRLNTKQSIREIEDFTEADYNNVAGYIVFPAANDVLDKSTVHPAEFGLVSAVCGELGLDEDKLVRNLGKLEEFNAEDECVGRFIKENIASQLKVAQRYQSLSERPKRRLRLREVEIDTVHDGRVTNITPFGAFVDISAFSDGLVHISELANDYVESPDQVVSVGDLVKVKVIEVNRKKKRISLSMKQADNKGIRVSASRAQLNDLASFFNS